MGLARRLSTPVEGTPIELLTLSSHNQISLHF